MSLVPAGHDRVQDAQTLKVLASEVEYGGDQDDDEECCACCCAGYSRGSLVGEGGWLCGDYALDETLSGVRRATYDGDI